VETSVAACFSPAVTQYDMVSRERTRQMGQGEDYAPLQTMSRTQRISSSFWSPVVARLLDRPSSNFS